MSMFSWGANSHGQLGLGFECELCVTPQRLSRLPFNPARVRSIKGGGGHVLALDKGGRLFSCGWNNRGQLGIGSTEDRNEFVAVPADYFDGSAVEEIACGWDSSGAITKSKQLYMWGSNSFQQLGMCQRGFSHITHPLHIDLPKNEAALKLSLGLRHCCVLADNNTIYVFGRLRIGDSPAGTVVKLISCNNVEILKVQPEFHVKMIASGQNHFIISDGIQVVGIGDNKFGQINKFSFDSAIMQIASGWTHNGILTKLKDLYLWGRNSYGQISGQTQQTVTSPRKLDIPDNHLSEVLHLGSEHAVVISHQGQIFSWGWNEHGNCGNGGVENLQGNLITVLTGDLFVYFYFSGTRQLLSYYLRRAQLLELEQAFLTQSARSKFSSLDHYCAVNSFDCDIFIHHS